MEEEIKVKGKIDLFAPKTEEGFLAEDLPEETLDLWLSEYTQDQTAIDDFKSYKKRHIDGHRITEDEIKNLIKDFVSRYKPIPEEEPTIETGFTEIKGASNYDYSYRHSPMLGYVCEVADHFHSDYYFGEYYPSHDPNIFAIRYFDGKIDESRKEEYLDDDNLMATLQAFELDPDKFWYLALYARDFVGYESELTNIVSSTVQSELDTLHDYLSNAGFEELPDSGSPTECVIKITGAKGRVTITQAQTLWYLKLALEQLKSDAEENFEISDFLNSAMVTGKKASVPKTTVVLLFKRMLDFFIRPLVANPDLMEYEKNKRGRTVKITASISKENLIGYMVYYTGLGGEEFLESNYLHSYIKKVSDDSLRKYGTLNPAYYA